MAASRLLQFFQDVSGFIWTAVNFNGFAVDDRTLGGSGFSASWSDDRELRCQPVGEPIAQHGDEKQDGQDVGNEPRKNQQQSRQEMKKSPGSKTCFEPGLPRTLVHQCSSETKTGLVQKDKTENKSPQ